jgi:acyl-CoA reductase-like NAD-dependent aldehyde dehydrogenase
MGDASALNPASYTNKLYLNGSYVPSKSTSTFSLKNPKDNTTVVSGIPNANAEDIDLAVQYAEEAFYNGPWSKFSALQRTECFVKLAALLEEQLIPILTLDSLTSGNPVSLIPTREGNYIKNCILYYAGWTDKLRGDYFPADDGELRISYPILSNFLTFASAISHPLERPKSKRKNVKKKSH